AERARQRVHVDPAGWWGSAEPVPHLRAIQDGVTQDRRLLLHYPRPNGEVVSRLVDPLGLVVKVNVWYLVACLADDEPAATPEGTGAPERELRVFRVSRLREVTPTDARAERPAGFDLPSNWTEWCARFTQTLPRYPVTLRVAPDFLPALRRRLWHVGQTGVPSDAAGLERGADGWLTLPPVDLEHFDQALEGVLSAGSQVEVVARTELRHAVAVH